MSIEHNTIDSIDGTIPVQRNEYGVDTITRARCIRAVWNRENRPPSQKEVGRESPHGHDFYHDRHEQSWGEVLEQTAGVPSIGTVVARELRRQFVDRYPWQEFIIVTASKISDAAGPTSSQVGQLLSKFESGERDHEALSGLVVIDTGMGSTHTKWKVASAE